MSKDINEAYYIQLFAEVLDKHKLINNPYMYRVLLGYALVGMTNIIGPEKTQIIVHNMLASALAKYSEKQLLEISDEDIGGLN